MWVRISIAGGHEVNSPISRVALRLVVPLLWLAAPAAVQGQWYVDNRASTPAESYGRGMSDMIRAAGAANLLNSEAARNYEEARSRYLENRLQATDTYFQMRSRNRAYREDERRPRPTSEELFRLAKARAPDRLSPSELDPISGEIVWPAALRDPRFAATQQRLERMFAYWAEHSRQLTVNQMAELQATIDQLTEELMLVVEVVPANTYAEARRFLASLAYELQLSQG